MDYLMTTQLALFILYVERIELYLSCPLALIILEYFAPWNQNLLIIS